MKGSKKSAKNRRIRLYDRGSVACPICLTLFTRDQAVSGKTVTLEHFPPKSLGGTTRCLTCKSCNSEAGKLDQVAAVDARRDRVRVVQNIAGKKRTFEISPEGKEITPPFEGYSKQDFEKLMKTGGRFTLTLEIPDQRAVALSALKSAYLAVFSLTGSYLYAWDAALEPVRQLIQKATVDDVVERYAFKLNSRTEVENISDINLMKEPFPHWIVRVSDLNFVALPLNLCDKVSTPLEELKSSGSRRVALSGNHQWPFVTFGRYSSISANLPGASSRESLVSLGIRGNHPEKGLVNGICIGHSGDSAVLLIDPSNPSQLPSSDCIPA